MMIQEIMNANELTKITEEHIRAREEEVKEKILIWLWDRMLEAAKNGEFSFYFYPGTVTDCIASLEIDDKINIKTIYVNILNYLKNLGYAVEGFNSDDDFIVVNWCKRREGEGK